MSTLTTAMTYPEFRKHAASWPPPSTNDYTTAGSREQEPHSRRTSHAQGIEQSEQRARTLHRKRSSYDLRYVFQHGIENHEYASVALPESTHDTHTVVRNNRTAQINPPGIVTH
ncbi:hypothetical protein Hypma_012035 [Hypsizygus marmoreus]|uniref:Uncharacterized protein n=1 Tax=Hypsizygus marmoreus TaxID=39966 RepID=A0A369JPZ2_HYPMA|nr:hypothetical protein Hypma_012035 [Hypsizygus marmoreus]